MLGSPSVTLDLTRGINSSATTCLRAVNKPHNDTHGVHLPYSWPRQKVWRLGRSWNVLTFCCFDYLQWELRRALKMEKQVTALCPRQGKHTEKSRTNPWVPIFFFLLIFQKKLLLLLVFVAVVLGPAAEAVDNFPTLFWIFFKLFPCVCALIGRGRRPIRTQPPRRWEWCHRSGIRFNQCHFFHLQAVRDALHRSRALLELCHCHVQPDHQPLISTVCPDRSEKAHFRFTNSNTKIILTLNKDNKDDLNKRYFRYIWDVRHCNEGILWGQSRKRK